MKTRFLLLILCIVYCKIAKSQGSIASIVNYSDTVYSGQPIELILRTSVLNNGPFPSFCSPIFSSQDSLIGGEITFDVIFNFAGPNNTNCWRQDTFNLIGYTQGAYSLNCNWFNINLTSSANTPSIFSADTVQVVVLNSTGIAKAAIENVTISPNPADGFFTIGGAQNEVNQIELFSLSGQKVRDFDAKETHHSLVGLENGIYLLRIYSNEGVVSRKLLVSR